MGANKGNRYLDLRVNVTITPSLSVGGRSKRLTRGSGAAARRGRAMASASHGHLRKRVLLTDCTDRFDPPVQSGPIAARPPEPAATLRRVWMLVFLTTCWLVRTVDRLCVCARLLDLSAIAWRCRRRRKYQKS